MWQQSLAFAAPLPSFVFQNVAFEASVRLVDENKATVTGYGSRTSDTCTRPVLRRMRLTLLLLSLCVCLYSVSKELAVTVRFHDSYDIVPDQSDVVWAALVLRVTFPAGHCAIV